jgi:hypothetical protein
MPVAESGMSMTASGMPVGRYPPGIQCAFAPPSLPDGSLSPDSSSGAKWRISTVTGLPEASRKSPGSRPSRSASASASPPVSSRMFCSSDVGKTNVVPRLPGPHVCSESEK